MLNSQPKAVHVSFVLAGPTHCCWLRAYNGGIWLGIGTKCKHLAWMLCLNSVADPCCLHGEADVTSGAGVSEAASAFLVLSAYTKF